MTDEFATLLDPDFFFYCMELFTTTGFMEPLCCR